MNRLLVHFHAFCALAASLVLPVETARAEDIVLGMSAAFTGPSKGLDIELYRGSMAYLDHVNGEGGVHGRKVVIKAYDDGYNPIPAIENTIRLIEKDDVFLLFDYVGTKDLVNSQVVPSYHDTTLPAVREYLEWTERHRPMPPRHLLDAEYQAQPPSFVGLEGFLNAKLLVAILKKLGPPFERPRLQEAAESIADLDLGIGMPVSFRAGRHQAMDHVYYTEVRDGRFESVDDWRRWRR